MLMAYARPHNYNAYMCLCRSENPAFSFREIVIKKSHYGRSDGQMRVLQNSTRISET